jgi:hypothetical protein
MNWIIALGAIMLFAYLAVGTWVLILFARYASLRHEVLRQLVDRDKPYGEPESNEGRRRWDQLREVQRMSRIDRLNSDKSNLTTSKGDEDE